MVSPIGEKKAAAHRTHPLRPPRSSGQAGRSAEVNEAIEVVSAPMEVR